MSALRQREAVGFVRCEWNFEEKNIWTNAKAKRELIEGFNSHATPRWVVGK